MADWQEQDWMQVVEGWEACLHYTDLQEDTLQGDNMNLVPEASTTVALLIA